MAIDIKTAIKNALATILLTTTIVIVISALIAHFSRWPFNEAFGFGLIFGGIIIMYAGTMASAGGAERGAVQAAYMTGGHHANYYEQYGRERQSRRDGQFWFMLLMVISGLILLSMGFYMF
ncbi:MAG: hypothetical protein R6W91_07000 [Thermoplasmata archaeon]